MHRTTEGRRVLLALTTGVAITAIIITTMIVILFSAACTNSTSSSENGADYWYAPNYPSLMEPALGEDLSYFDWGFLLSSDTEKLIDSGDGWKAYSRGDFEGYSVLFALSDRGIHDPEWQDRLVEVYPDHADEIVLQRDIELFTMDARKYEDGTYSYCDYETGIFHIDADGNVLHEYLDYNNGHES